MAEAARRFSWRTLLERAGRGLLRLPLPVAVALPFLWMGLIWHLSSQSFAPPPELGLGLWEYFANLAHAPLFGLLALFWCALLLRGPREGARLPRLAAWHAGVAIVLVAAYALVDEWHQSTTPGRDPSPRDVGTDLLGAACVLWIVASLGGTADEGRLRRRLLLCLAACLGYTALHVSIARLS